MPTLVSTGQITIVDNNDARPISAVITGSGAFQQVYTKDESSVTYTPNWTSTPLTLTARVYVGGTASAQEVAAQLTNRKWSTTFDGTSIGSGTTLTVNTNLTTATPSVTYYFQGDYTDPVTGLVSRVVANVTLNLVSTGTNAVYIVLKTPDGTALEPNHPTNPTSNIRVIADVVRVSGVDDTGITYRWFESPHAAANQVDGNLSGVTTKYGVLDTAAANANRTPGLGQFATGSGTTTAAITTTNMPDGGWVDAKGLMINANAVADIGVFKVEAKDADGKIYSTFFTVTDLSDPYDVRIISTAGDKFQNGVGSSDVYPIVYYGSQRVTDTTGWTFEWTFYDRNGVRGAFIDTTKTAQADGRTITANTAGATGTITYSGTAITFAAGDIVKAVAPNGVADFYEVGSSSGNVITLRAATTHPWLSYPAMVASEFVNGKLFACVPTRTTNGANGDPLASKITVTGYEVDAKANFVCAANKP